MVAVQPEGCDPIAQAWRAGRTVKPLDDCASAVSGIILTAPPDGDLALDALRESDGWAVSIPDSATYQAQAEMAAAEGIFAEPGGGRALGGGQARSAARASYGARRRAVCLVTGIGFKDSAALRRMTEGVALPMIEADEITRIRE